MTNPDNRHPTGFWFVFWGELAERASFYGMKGLLILYMINKMGYSDADSATVSQIFTAASYILPIAGGYIADRWLGKFKTILYFAIPYIGGHLILGTFTHEVGFYTALLLLAGGSGAIKPNISTLMGLMYQEQRKMHLLSQAFSWFYMAINIGAAASMLTLPFVRDRYGYSAAFMAPTILMVVSLFIFYLGKKHYPVEDAKARFKEPKTPEQKKEEWAVIRKLSGVFLLIVFFWSIFDQAQSTWTLFARDYLILELPLIGSVPADAVQGINPILIVLLTPLFAWTWSRTDRAETKRLSSAKKMLFGFILVTACMGVMAVAGYFAAAGRVSLMWEVVAYILVTMGELCISVIGLQMAFEEAPDRMKSMLTGVWLFTVFLGNVLAAFLARIYTQTTPMNYFLMMTAMMAVVTVAFYFVGRRFERRSAVAA